jgi:molecular chaperone DnaK
MSIGIDFGTSNCSVSIFKDKLKVLNVGSNVPLNWNFKDFDKIFPSNFAIKDNEYLFGWPAKVAKNGSEWAVKRILSGHEIVTSDKRYFSADEVAALLFSSLSDMASTQGIDFEEAVVTIPSNISAKARYRTKLAAGRSGIRVKALIKEPTAAAMAYVHKTREKPERLLVFDWGGGTVDATLLESNSDFYEERVSVGRPVGGLEIDRRLAELITNKLPKYISYEGEEKIAFKLSLERLKINLCATKNPDEEMFIVTPDGYEIGITRRIFENDISFLVKLAMEPIHQILKHLNLIPGQIDDFIMVGGSSYIPLAQQYLVDIMKSDLVNFDLINPLTAISEGAAIACGQLNGEVSGGFSVISDFSLGAQTVKNGKQDYEIMIPKGVSLPYKTTKQFHSRTSKEGITLDIWEVGNPKTENVFDDTEQSYKLEKFVIPNPARNKAERETDIDLTFRYDRSGILYVTATEVSSKKLIFSDKVDFYSSDISEINPEIQSLEEIHRVKKSQIISSLMSSRVIPEESIINYTGPILVVDGSNIAFEGTNKNPSYARLQHCINSLRDKYPGAPIHVIADANLIHKLDESEKALMQKAVDDNQISLPPAGSKGKADFLILQVAEKINAIIVSNDSYREFQNDFSWLKSGERLVGAKFIANSWFFIPRVPPGEFSSVANISIKKPTTKIVEEKIHSELIDSIKATNWGKASKPDNHKLGLPDSGVEHWWSGE